VEEEEEVWMACGARGSRCRTSGAARRRAWAGGMCQGPSGAGQDAHMVHDRGKRGADGWAQFKQFIYLLFKDFEIYLILKRSTMLFWYSKIFK
jgi:hypothetical protein